MPVSMHTSVSSRVGVMISNLSALSSSTFSKVVCLGKDFKEKTKMINMIELETRKYQRRLNLWRVEFQKNSTRIYSTAET